MMSAHAAGVGGVSTEKLWEALGALAAHVRTMAVLEAERGVFEILYAGSSFATAPKEGHGGSMERREKGERWPGAMVSKGTRWLASCPDSLVQEPAR